jgi:hypothetical protein
MGTFMSVSLKWQTENCLLAIIHWSHTFWIVSAGDGTWG